MMKNKCVICGEEIPMNDSDSEGPYLNEKADVLMLGRITMAFIADTGFSVEDWESCFERGLMHGACFDKWTNNNACRKCHVIGSVLSNRGYCHQCEIDFPKWESRCMHGEACFNHDEKCDDSEEPPKCFTNKPLDEPGNMITRGLRPGIIVNKTILSEKNNVAQAMIECGEPFIMNLGNTLLHAGMHDSVKIAGAFPEYWKKYLVLGIANKKHECKDHDLKHCSICKWRIGISCSLCKHGLNSVQDAPCLFEQE